MKYTEEKNTVIRGAGYSIAGRASGAFLGLVALALLYRFFESDTGLWAFAFSIIIMIEPFARCGLTEGVQKFTAVNVEKKNWAGVRGTLLGGIQIASIACVTVTAIFILFTPQIASFFSKNTEFSDEIPRLSRVLKLYSLYLLPLVLTTIMLAFLRALKNIRITVFIENVFNRVAWITVIITAALIPTRYDRLLLLIFGANITMAAAALITALCIPRAAPQLKKTVPVYQRKELLLFSIPLVFQSILLIFMKRVDILMLKYFYSIEGFDYVRTYYAAGTIAFQAGIILSAFASLFAPMIAGVYHRHDLKQLDNLYKTVTRWCMICALPVIIFILVVPDLALQALNITPSPAAQLTVRLLTIGQLISISVGHSGYMLIMSGHTRLTLTNNSIALVANVILNYILIPQYAMPGAAIATVVAITLRNMLSLVEVRYILSASPFSRATLKFAGLALAAGATVAVMRIILPPLYWYIELPLSCLIFGAIYLPMMWFTLSTDDRNFFTNFIRRKHL
jgi:O-antigen/teichoic acid export membrane protein